MRKDSDLRNEYHTPEFQSSLIAHHGTMCVNCGSEADAWHHIVPLSLGGTNNIANIVPLCSRCHKAAHHGRHLSHYFKGKISGRPRKARLEDEGVRDLMLRWSRGEIGNKELHSSLGLGRACKFRDTALYAEFKEEYGIADVHNTVDVGVKKGGKVGSVITYLDGRQEFFGSKLHKRVS